MFFIFSNDDLYNTYVNNQSIIMLKIESEPSKVPYKGNLSVRSPVLVQLKAPETLACH